MILGLGLIGAAVAVGLTSGSSTVSVYHAGSISPREHWTINPSLPESGCEVKAISRLWLILG